jgi:hypothetical protein
VVGHRAQRDDAVAAGQPQGAPVRAVPPLLDAGDGGGDEVAEQVVRGQRRAERQPQRERARRGGRRAAGGARSLAVGRGPAAQLGGGECEDLAHGLVERADAREAGRGRDLGHRQRRRLDEQARGLRPLRAGQRERPGAELGGEEPVDLARAVAEPRREALDAALVDDAVRDQAHGAGDDVGADVPFRRAGAGVRAAALAGAEAGPLRGGRRRVEPHVLGLRRHDGAARPAVDAGGQDGGEEPAVEPGVLGLHRADAAFRVLVHPATLAPFRPTGPAEIGHGGGGPR